ncbi:MAG: hypothetical protein SXG53_10590 [Pseudomonadota bacterium]|nr:hypothetical protein [Pseudomonadota bacterium]
MTKGESSVVILDDRRIAGGNEQYHFVGTYRREAGRIFFRAFVAYHGEQCTAPPGEHGLPYEAEGIGEISPDRKRIDYVARVVGRPDCRIEGCFVRLAEVPNFRKLS